MLFVYGTLLSNEQNLYSNLLRCNGRIIGPAWVQGKLYRISWYPGAVPSQDPNDLIHGQLVEIWKESQQTLVKIDEYEGVSNNPSSNDEYVRSLVKVQTKFRPFEAWIYWYASGYEESKRIASGDFRKT